MNTQPDYTHQLPVLGISTGIQYKRNFLLWEANHVDTDKVTLKVEGENSDFIVLAIDFFDALRAIRIKFEERDEQVICNGSCIDVWPSAMQSEMSTGFLAYRRRLGVTPTFADMIHVFGTEIVDSHVTVAEQNAYFDRWIASFENNNPERDTKESIDEWLQSLIGPSSV